MLALQPLFVEQEEIVRDGNEQGLRLLGHQTRRPGCLLAQLILDLIKGFLGLPAPPKSSTITPEANPVHW